MAILTPQAADKSGIKLPILRYVAILIIGFIFINSCFSFINQGEAGVKLRFGAMVNVQEPGIAFKIPFIEQIIHMSVRTEKISLQKMEAYSKDIQAANLQVSIAFHLEKAKVGSVYSTLGTNFAERIIVPATLRLTKETFGQYNAQNIITERAELGKQIQDKIQAFLEPYGLELDGFQLEDISFSQAYEQSIENRMQAEVEVLKLKQNLEREKVQADILRTQAAGTADALRAQAQAEADATKIRASADAASIQLRGEAEAKAIAARGDALKANNDIIKLTQAERWDGKLPQTMLPNTGVPMIDLRQQTEK